MSRPLADADAFRAIADPTRRRIIDLLRRAPHSPTELMAALKRPSSTLSSHLRILRDSGLVTQQRNGVRRVYTLRPDRLSPVNRWLAKSS